MSCLAAAALETLDGQALLCDREEEEAAEEEEEVDGVDSIDDDEEDVVGVEWSVVWCDDNITINGTKSATPPLQVLYIYFIPFHTVLVVVVACCGGGNGVRLVKRQHHHHCLTTSPSSNNIRQATIDVPIMYCTHTVPMERQQLQQ